MFINNYVVIFISVNKGSEQEYQFKPIVRWPVLWRMRHVDLFEV